MKTTLEKSVTLLSTVLAGSVFAATPSIPANGVSMLQDANTRTVTITYTLESAPAIVTLDIQTNGVSIGCRHFQNLGGDVNMKVSAGTHTITWQPDVEWSGAPQRVTAENVKAVVKAWACDAPPPYAVFDLVNPNTVRFYSCAEAVPGGVNTNPRYKEDLLVMRRIPAANVTWRMGSPSSEPTDGRAYEFANSETPHYVMLTEDYYMAVFETTQKQYSHFADATLVGYFTDKGDHRPVDNNNWYHVRGTTHGVNWMTEGHAVDDGSPLANLRAHTGGVMFDLPTEAQWEYACRAGTGTGLNNGKECDSTDYANASEVAWHNYNTDGGATYSHDVGLKAPNAWGLYDMHGNVAEYCLDRYSEGSDYVATFGANYVAGSVVVDPIGAMSGSAVVLRGGSYYDAPRYCRSARRNSTTARSRNYGFRLCCPASF